MRFSFVCGSGVSNKNNNWIKWYVPYLSSLLYSAGIVTAQCTWPQSVCTPRKDEEEDVDEE